MKYRILIRPQAKASLQAQLRLDRQLLVEKIVMLGVNPQDARLNIKRLPGASWYRLRTASFYILYVKGRSIKIMSIDKIEND